LSDSFLGNLTQGVLSKINSTTLIYKAKQPLGTIARHIIIIPENAEKEIGFPYWLIKVWNIARNTGAKLVFYGTNETLDYIREIHKNHPVDASFFEFPDWKDFISIVHQIKSNDNVIIIMSRKDNQSYNKMMKHIPVFLKNEISSNSFILIYPLQMGVIDDSTYDYLNPSLLEPMRGKLERLDEITKTITRLFVKK
jgi:hypothetical protein